MEDDRLSLSAGAEVSGTAYGVIGLIGRGGMGRVYEVEHRALGKRFVMKVLHEGLLCRDDLVARMHNEWRTLGQLEHPNIVKVTDAGRTDEGLPFFVMERLEGEVFSEMIRRLGKLPADFAVRVALDVLAGLEAAHALGAIHRDVKPQNIFITPSGAKLLDFGIAKLRDRAQKVVTKTGVAIGTPRYMAPEQAAGGRVDRRADLYATGLVLFEALAGKGPFAHIRDPNELVIAHIGEEPARVDHLVSGLPAELGDFVHSLLAKEPSHRPPSAAAAQMQLRSLLQLLPSEPDFDADVTTFLGNYDESTVGPATVDPAVGDHPIADTAGAGQSALEVAQRLPLATSGNAARGIVILGRASAAAAQEQVPTSEAEPTPTETLDGDVPFAKTVNDQPLGRLSHRSRPSRSETPPPLAREARAGRQSSARSKQRSSPAPGILVAVGLGVALLSFLGLRAAWSRGLVDNAQEHQAVDAEAQERTPRRSVTGKPSDEPSRAAGAGTAEAPQKKQSNGDLLASDAMNAPVAPREAALRGLDAPSAHDAPSGDGAPGSSRPSGPETASGTSASVSTRGVDAPKSQQAQQAVRRAPAPTPPRAAAPVRTGPSQTATAPQKPTGPKRTSPTSAPSAPAKAAPATPLSQLPESGLW